MNTITVPRKEIDDQAVVNEAIELNRIARECFTHGLRAFIDTYDRSKMTYARSELFKLRKVAEAYNDHEAVSDIDFILKYGK